MSRFAKLDLRELARQLGEDLDSAIASLEEIYADVDARNATNTADLDLPCHRGCDMCCHESVFMTPLEFFAAWDYVQSELSDDVRDDMVTKGLALYQENREIIDALNDPPPEGSADHFAIASQLKFRCPMLGDQGQCRVYPRRELYARLFGCSFNDDGGVYGCHLVGDHLAGKTVKLVTARPNAQRLLGLPLTFKRQVYPYYINLLYGQ